MVLIVADGTVRDGCVIFGCDLQSITILDYALDQIAAAAALVVEIVIAGIMRDGRTTCHVHGCAGFDIDGRSVAHPYRCVDQVQQRADFHIDVVGHSTVIIAQIRAPFRTVRRSDSDRAIVRSLCHPAHHHK